MHNKLAFLDDKYFVSGKHDLQLCLDIFYFDIAPNFSTSHDFKVAPIMANDLLCAYLKTGLSLIERNKRTDTIWKSKCAWTDKEIALFMENIFDFDLGDFYRTYLEIKNRQNPPKFLDTMRAALVKKFEE